MIFCNGSPRTIIQPGIQNLEKVSYHSTINFFKKINFLKHYVKNPPFDFAKKERKKLFSVRNRRTHTHTQTKPKSQTTSVAYKLIYPTLKVSLVNLMHQGKD